MRKLYTGNKTTLFLLLSIALIICGCDNTRTKKIQNDNIPVKMDTVVYCDSIDDPINRKIIVHTKAVLPFFAKNDSKTTDLINTISKNIFNIECNESTDNKTTVIQFTNDILDSYRSPLEEKANLSLYKDINKTHKYEISNEITPVYNKNGILCFCRTSEMKKNGTRTMLSNYYYSFDINNNSRISIADIFNPDYTSTINKLLKEKLMQQEKVESTSQLIDLGYFNIDNLVVSNNFYFTDSSIVFNYEPFEIACYAIGDVCICLDLDTLKPYFRTDIN